MDCIVVGSSGLIGNLLVNELLINNSFDHIILLVRKELVRNNKRIKQIVFSFDDEEAYKELPKVDSIFCCIGTTINIAKTKENFRKVDFFYPLFLAKNVSSNSFHLVSSMGADSRSSIFYSKTKGELEDELKKLNFTSLCIYQPSQLVGKRKGIRNKEMISEKIMNLFSFFIPKNYKLIKAKIVAKAMSIKSIDPPKGIHIFLSGEIKQIVTNETN